MMKKNKFLRMLAVMGALWGTTPKASAEGAEAQQRDLKTDTSVTLFVNGEKASGQKAFGDITIQPEVRIGNDERNIKYEGSIYRLGWIDGQKTDWMTLASNISLETEDWQAMIGRDFSRFETAGYLHAATTTAFSNDVRANGTSRTITGANLTYKPLGVELGYIASDGRMTPTHWDTALFGYKKQFDDQWGVQFQIGGGKEPLTYGGATLAWTPDKNNALVADVIYKDHKTTGVLTARHDITDSLAIFAGVEVGKPNQGKIGGLAEAGLSYNFGKGFTGVAAVQQDIGGKHATHAVIGLQYVGNFASK